MKTDGAIRFVMSPEDARSWVNFLNYQGAELPLWAQEWDGESPVWLDEYGY